MTKLQELRDALAEKKKHEREANDRAIKIALGICDGFRQYLELPRTWEDVDNRQRTYVQYYDYDEEGSDTVNPNNHKNIREVLLICYANEIRFKAGFILDVKDGAFPKQLYTFNIRSNLYGDTLTVEFGDFGSVTCVIPENSEWYDFTPAHEKLHSIILNHLNQRIGDADNQRHVGFKVTQL